jgi:hypothetical protein
MKKQYDIPKHYLCPISGDIMWAPVTDSLGKTYNKQSIESWHTTFGTNYSTNQPMANQELLPNEALRTEITGWLKNYYPDDLYREFLQRYQTSDDVFSSIAGFKSIFSNIIIRMLPPRDLYNASRACRFFRSNIPSELRSKLARIVRERHLPPLNSYEDSLQKNDANNTILKSVVIGVDRLKTFPLINRFVHKEFYIHYKNTMGVDFKLKVFQFGGTKLCLQLWSRNAIENLKYMIKYLYKDTDIIYLISDLNNQKALDALQESIAEVEKHSPPEKPPLLVLLLLNAPKNNQNTDLEILSITDIDALVYKHNIVNWYNIDSVDIANISEAFTSGLRHHLAIRYPQVIRKTEILPDKPISANKAGCSIC